MWCAHAHALAQDEGPVGLLLTVKHCRLPERAGQLWSCRAESTKGGLNLDEEQRRMEVREEMRGHSPSSGMPGPPVMLHQKAWKRNPVLPFSVLSHSRGAWKLGMGWCPF